VKHDNSLGSAVGRGAASPRSLDGRRPRARDRSARTCQERSRQQWRCATSASEDQAGLPAPSAAARRAIRECLDGFAGATSMTGLAGRGRGCQRRGGTTWDARSGTDTSKGWAPRTRAGFSRVIRPPIRLGRCVRKMLSPKAPVPPLASGDCGRRPCSNSRKILSLRLGRDADAGVSRTRKLESRFGQMPGSTISAKRRRSRGELDGHCRPD